MSNFSGVPLSPSLNANQSRRCDLFRVVIASSSASVEKHAWAIDERAALLAVIESLPSEHPLFGAAGWSSVSCFRENQAVIVKGVRRA